MFSYLREEKQGKGAKGRRMTLNGTWKDLSVPRFGLTDRFDWKIICPFDAGVEVSSECNSIGGVPWFFSFSFA